MALLGDLRYAVRLLRKDPWFAAVAVLVLGLGIGLNTTVFTLVNAVLIRGLPFDDPDRIFLVSSVNSRTGDTGSLSYPDFLDLQAQARVFTGLAAWRGSTVNVSEPGQPPERVSGTEITANTFALIGQRPVLGRAFTAEDQQPGAPAVVIIGDGLWTTRYGRAPDVLGRTIRLNDRPAVVIGVMPPGLQFPPRSDLWQPLVPRDDPDAETSKRDARNLGVFGRLQPGVSRRAADAELAGITSRLEQAYGTTNKDLRARLMTFNERYNGGPIRMVFLALMGAVGFVLLIACANVANLLLARSSSRTREVAVRFALGASRMRVVRQLLAESLLLAAIAGIVGLALAVVGARLFDAAVADVGKPYWIRFTLDGLVFGFMAAVCLGTSVLFGLAPALQVSRTNVNDVLKDGSRGTAGGVRSRRLTSTMVVAEIALTIVLLTGAGLMVRSFLTLYSMDIGIDTAPLLTMRTVLSQDRYPTPERRQQFFDRALERLRRVPGVAAASTTSILPLNAGFSEQLDVEGRPAPQPADPRAATLVVGDGYFETMALPILQGRAFTDRDGRPGAEAVIVDQQFVTQFFPGEDPLGRRIRPHREPARTDPNPWRVIVGIVPTVRQQNPQNGSATGTIYQAFRQSPLQGTVLVVRATADPGGLAGAVRQALLDVDAEQPVFDVRTMDAVLAQARWPYRVFGTMFAIFAVVALVLSTVGIYAVTAYAVSQRRAEIGVRMALGALPRQVSWLVLRSGLWQLGLGLALGLAGAWGATRVIGALMVGVSATDPLTFLSVAAIIAVATLAACAIPARRATRFDPLSALRT